MTDITTATFDEMEPLHEGLARRTRAALNVTGWGMQLFTLPPNWDGYPTHTHGPDDSDPNQEEVYIPLEGEGMLQAGEASVALRPGMMVRVGPTQPRRILPGAGGIRFLAIGGHPGEFDAAAWTELGGPVPGA